MQEESHAVQGEIVQLRMTKWRIFNLSGKAKLANLKSQGLATLGKEH